MDDWESDWCGCIQSLDRRAIVESSVGEESSNIEGQGRDVVDQSLDRVACWFITTDGRDCDDKRFRRTEDESSEVVMVLRGAIAGVRVTEFASIGVGTPVVMDINEVEADDPRPRPEDYRRLLSEDVVDSGFEVIGWNGV